MTTITITTRIMWMSAPTPGSAKNPTNQRRKRINTTVQKMLILLLPYYMLDVVSLYMYALKKKQYPLFFYSL